MTPTERAIDDMLGRLSAGTLKRLHELANLRDEDSTVRLVDHEAYRVLVPAWALADVIRATRQKGTA